MKIAINIKTEEWNRIIKGLIREEWKVEMKYDEFDAGIDFDFLVLKKEKNKIEFGWDNWVEGEIKCSDDLMEMIQYKFKISLNFGEPVNLKPNVIRVTKFQIWLNRFRRMK